MKKEKGNIPANQHSSKSGAGNTVRENDSKAAENQTKHTLRK